MSKGFLLGKHLSFSLTLALLSHNGVTAAIPSDFIDDATEVTTIKKSSKEILSPKTVKKRNWRKIALITAGIVTAVAAVSALYYFKATTLANPSQENLKVRYAGVIPVKQGYCFAGEKTYETLDSVLLYKGPMLNENYTSSSHKFMWKDFCQSIPEGMTPETAATEALNNTIPGVFDVKPDQLEFIAYYPMRDRDTLTSNIAKDQLCAGYIVKIPDLDAKIAKTNKTNKINTINDFNQTDQLEYISIMPSKETHYSSITDLYLSEKSTLHVDHHYSNNVLAPLYKRYVFPFFKKV